MEHIVGVSAVCDREEVGRWEEKVRRERERRVRMMKERREKEDEMKERGE